jgi:phosphopantetheine adenylyltransferase
MKVDIRKVAGSKFADLITVIRTSKRWGYLYLGVVKHPHKSPMFKLDEEKGMSDLVSIFEVGQEKIFSKVLGESIIFDFLKEKNQ